VLPEVFDIISIPMIGATPRLYQSENYVIDPDYYWVKRGQLSWPDIKEFGISQKQSATSNTCTCPSSRRQRIFSMRTRKPKTGLAIVEAAVS
jgi:hypothetical protein